MIGDEAVTERASAIALPGGGERFDLEHRGFLREHARGEGAPVVAQAIERAATVAAREQGARAIERSDLVPDGRAPRRLLDHERGSDRRRLGAAGGASRRAR